MARISPEKRQQIVVVAVVGALALAGAWWFGIRALKSRLTQVGAKIVEVKTKEQEARKLVQQADQRQADLDAAHERLATIEDKMIAGDMNNWIRTVIITFKSTANYGSLDINTFSSSEELRTSMLPDFPYRSFLYRVNGTAYYHDLGRFLADFENAYPHIRVLNVDLQPVDPSQGKQAEALNFTVEIVALLKPPS
jgi:Tfp pilus assembly protein PilO